MKKAFQIIRIFTILLFALAMVYLGFAKMENQPVTLVVDAKQETAKVTFSAQEVDALESFFVEMPGVGLENLREVRIYRKFASVCVDKITTGNFERYAEIDSDGITFNEKACDLLRSNSKSFLFERIFLLLILLGVLIFVWIVLNAIEEKASGDRRDNHGPIHEIGRFCGDVGKYWQYMVFAANADLKAEVANSYLNRLWWLLEPLFSMLVYVVVFGRIMGNSVENYATFTFSALLMWNFFSKTMNYSVKCVRNNRDIVTKVYVPKHVLLITNMILNMFKLIFSLIVLIPMLVIFHVQIGLAVFWVIPTYLVMILLSFGAGMILLHFGVYIDDLAYAVNILLQMLMFLSGIFYDVVTSLPTPLNAMMLELNPVSMFIDSMRNALLSNLVANVPLIVLWTVLSLELCYIGVHIVYKNENGYVKVV